MSPIPEERTQATPTGAPTQSRSTGAMNFDAMSGLQADELQKLIESLQVLTAARQEHTQKPPMQTETAPVEDDIQWEHLSTGRVQATAHPHVRPPITQTTASTQPPTRKSIQNNIPPPQVATLAEACSQQQKTNSLAAYPAIFDLQENSITSTTERKWRGRGESGQCGGMQGWERRWLWGSR